MPWRLFIIFFRIGVFTIGGGYIMIPLIQREVVEHYRLIGAEEIIDLIATAQSAPGVMAVNLAVLLGYRLAGTIGALAAALGAILPSFICILIMAAFLMPFYGHPAVQAFFRGARPAVVALLVYSAYSLGRTGIREVKGLAVGAGVFALLVAFNVHPILVIMAAGLSGWFLFREEKEAGRL